MGESGNGSKPTRVRSVKGLTTFFEFDPRNRDYKSFLAAREAHEKIKFHVAGGSDYLKSAAAKHFLDFITPYLTEEGFDLAEEYPSELLTIDNELAISCAKVNIVPGDESNILNYQPWMRFHATSRGLRADGYLRRNWKKGAEGLLVLNDMLKLIPPSNGIIRPRVNVSPKANGPGETFEMEVASTSQIKYVLRGLGAIYDNIRGRRLEELQSLRDAIGKVEGHAQEVLRTEYQKSLEMLLPKHIM